MLFPGLVNSALWPSSVQNRALTQSVLGRGGRGEEWKEVFVRKESSSPVVWEGRGQGSGHTERARLGAKRLVADDLTHKK